MTALVSIRYPRLLRCSAAACAVLGLAAVSLPANAGLGSETETIFDNLGGPADGGVWFNLSSDSRSAQPFRLNDADTFVSVTIRLDRVGEPDGSIHVDVFEDSGAATPGIWIARLGSISAAGVSASPADYVFDVPVTGLVPRALYHVVLSHDGTAWGDSDNVGWLLTTRAGAEGAPQALALEPPGVVEWHSIRRFPGGGPPYAVWHSMRVVPHPDPDRDGVPSDGDLSGLSGDRPCLGGGDSGCDDNCPSIANPDQLNQDLDEWGDVCDASSILRGKLIAVGQERGSAIHVGYLDGDGNPDLVLLAHSSDEETGANVPALVTLLGDGTGDFTVKSTVEPERFMRDFSVSQVDGQFGDDVSTINGLGYRPESYRLYTYPTDSEGSLTAVQSVSLDFDPVSMTTGRFDNDRIDDFVISHALPFGTTLLTGDGVGGIATIFQISSEYYPRATGDLQLASRYADSDANLDLVTDTAVLYGDGLGGFTDAACCAAPIHVDLDGDGLRDLVSRAAHSHISWARGDGDRSFGPFEPIIELERQRNGDYGPTLLASGDFDGNGTRDLAVVPQFIRHGSIYFNDGHGELSPGETFGTRFAYDVAVGDLNQDGSDDLAIAGPEGFVVILPEPGSLDLQLMACITALLRARRRGAPCV